MELAEHVPVSANICRPTLRGIPADTPPEKSWFPIFLMCRHMQFSWDEDPDFLFFGDTGDKSHLLYPARTIRIFLTGENIQANWREADYALTHERVWSDRHWRLPLWRHWYDKRKTVPMRDFSVVKGRVDRFCNFIYSNDRAQERIQFFHLLNAYKVVDSCGRVLNNTGGPVKDKRAYLARCKFTIAFENESHPGYATEKIIEPLLVGSIPIYWGDPRIDEDFNPECFVNVHRFRSFAEVLEEVRRIDQDEEVWKQYVTAPLFRGGELPDRLTDEAITGWLDRVFLEKKHRVPRPVKAAQKSLQLMRHSRAVRFLTGFDAAVRRICRGAMRRIAPRRI